MLDKILSGPKALKNPWVAFLAGLIFASAAIILSRLTFPEQASLVMVFLTVLVVIPLTYSIAKLEFNKDMATEDPAKMLSEHKGAISTYTYLFLGVTFCFMIWYIFLPAQSAQDLFMTQTETINKINAPTALPNQPGSGQAVTGGYSSAEHLFKIFFNNFRVLLFSVLFSFVYGIGFIFIIIWNASVIATAAGNVIRVKLSSLALAISSGASSGIGTYFSIISVGVMRYIVHGTAEIVAYIIAGFAGSIISIYLIRNGLKFEHAYKITVDVADLLLVSVVLLFIAAIIEVYVTPKLFPI